MQTSETLLLDFLTEQSLDDIIKTKTCFKCKNGTAIDLILTNYKCSFQHTNVLETGLSDHHLMIYTMFKSTYYREPPKMKTYRCFKKFSQEDFLRDLYFNLNTNIFSYDYRNFEAIFTSTLESYASIKQRVIRGNDKPFVSNKMRKEIMLRSRLKGIANKSKLPEDYSRYKVQRNKVVALNKKNKKEFFSNLCLKTDQKNFWEACKPILSSKPTYTTEKINLERNGFVITDDHEVAKTLNENFINVVSKLNLNRWKSNKTTCNEKDPIEKALKMFSDHPSVLKIKATFQKENDFSFKHITPIEILKQIKKLKTKKGVSGVIPTHILQLAKDVCASKLADCFNTALNNSVFPNELKLADIIPCFKKKDPMDPSNYRPISLLPVISKVFESIIHEQLCSFMKNKLSKYLCGFRKGYSTQHTLLNMITKWQKCLDKKGGIVGTILMDLSKAYDCIDHNLIIAKLQAYGLSEKSLRFIHSYLTGRHQRVKVGNTYSEWLEIFFGVPQGSILGPILFNIFLNDLFLFIEETEICNFADDNTLFACDTSLQNVLDRLKRDVDRVNAWFENNSMIANPDKFQIMFLGVKNPTDISLNICGTVISGTPQVELLGITIDHKLTFSNHVKILCKNANNKISALLRFRNMLNYKQTLVLVNCYILSYFYYCPIIWMFCNKREHNLIQRTHKRALKVLLNNFEADYPTLLKLGNSVSIHTKHLQALMVEIFKTKNSHNPEFMKEIFKQKNITYELRATELLTLVPTRTSTFGTRAISFKGSLIWNKLPKRFKEAKSLNIFKKSIKQWTGTECSCKGCA